MKAPQMTPCVPAATPEAWLTDVLTRLPQMTNQDDLAILLPCNWQPPADRALPHTGTA